MNTCVGEEWGASCDNRGHQQEEHINAGMGESAMEQKRESMTIVMLTKHRTNAVQEGGATSSLRDACIRCRGR